MQPKEMYSKILELVPEPSAKRIAIRVHPAAEQALRQGHPWLFDRGIREISHAGKPGDLAVIFDRQRKFLAIGLFDPQSPIRVRILQHKTPATIDKTWFFNRLSAAARQREEIPTSTNGYRLVHGENDGLPGIVIDRYAETLVLRLDTGAWIPHLASILACLRQIQPADRSVLRLSRNLEQHPKTLYGLEDGAILTGQLPGRNLTFKENGLVFEVDPVQGQKTGFFLDQRENRARVEALSSGKNILNVFAYTGGFSLYAARGGAREVTSIDISQPALQTAQRNFNRNQNHPNIAACQHHTITADAFDYLQQAANQGQAFDLVILDPPSFARRQSQINRAIQAYQRLTRLGLAVLKPGGILVQASCSSRVAAEAFFASIHQAARAIQRPLDEIERSEHALDHPVGFPEGAYLKCLFARG